MILQLISESVTAALDTLSMLAGDRRKIACISGMRELENTLKIYIQT